MQRYYSPGAGGFFSDDVHGPTEDRESMIPSDAIAIDDATWLGLLASTSQGQVIVIENGGPVAVDPTAPEGEA